MNTQILKGEIVTAFGTQGKFAEFISWPENKVSRMMQGKYKPDTDEVYFIAQALNLSKEKFIQIFLQK